MRSLMRKEWLESRVLILAFFVMAPVGFYVAQWTVMAPGLLRPALTAELLTAGLVGLFTLLLASDLLAADTGSGRVRLLASLPISPGTVWSAKLVFLLVTITAYVSWVVATQAGLLWTAGEGAPEYLDAITGLWAWSLPLLAVLLAAAVFWSTLLDRGMHAAFAALGTLGLLERTLAGLHVDLRHLGNLEVACIVAAAGFLAASFVAYTRGRVHLGSRRRRALLASLVLVLVMLPPTAFAAAAVHRWEHPRPSDVDLDLFCYELSPDRRWAMVVAERKGGGPLGARDLSALWAVRLADGVVRDLTEIGGVRGGAVFATEPDRVVLLYPEEARRRAVYDLARGEVSRAESVPPEWAHHPLSYARGEHRIHAGGRSRTVLGRPSVQIPREWVPLLASAPWGLAVGGHTEAGWVTGVFDFDTQTVHELPGNPLLLPESREGPVWFVTPFRPMQPAPDDEQALETCSLDGSCRRVVETGVLTGRSTAPDARHAVVVMDGRVLLLRSDSQEPERLDAGEAVDARWAEWSPDSRRALLFTGEAAFLLDCDREPRLRKVPMPSVWQRGLFDGESVLVAEHGQGTLDLYGIDGSVRRLLPTP